jgi:hypothetical protein
LKRTLLLVVLVAAGCGSGTRHAAPPAPRLPRALAHDWARQANAVAAALAAGDGCTAHARASALQQDVVAAVNAHRVPRRFLEPLTSGVNELAARTACVPPPVVSKPAPPPRPPHGHDHPHDHGHGRGHGHGEGGD